MANAVVTVLEADGVTETDVTVLDVGRQAAAASKSLTLATEDKAVLDAIAASLAVLDDFDESDRAKVNPIVGQAGVAAGAGAVDATVQRMTLASDDPAVVDLAAIEVLLGTIDADTGNIATAASAIQTAVQIMDDWDESDRAKVNPIVGQAGVAAGAGAVSATVQRMTLASDDPAVALLGTMDTDTGNIATSLAVIDDWDESDRAKVNPIVGQAGVAAGAGAVGATVQRMTLASDDPGVALLGTIDTDTGNIATAASAIQTAVQIMDDWDESDRAKVNPIVGQAGVAAGAGSVSATVQRMTLASDDPGVALLGTIDADTSALALLSRAEDAAHSSAHTGIVPLAVRRDAKAVGSDTDGDYSTLNVSADGDLRVDGGKAHIVRVAPTVTAGAYTANDTLGGEMTITNAARVSGGSGILTGITMAVEDDGANLWVADDVEVLIFDSNPAGTYTDNAALDSSSLTDADAFLLVGSVLLDTASALGNVVLLKASNVNIPYVCSGSANLFAVAINRGGRTPDATDAIQFTFHMIRD